jgi:hypothetical protein
MSSIGQVVDLKQVKEQRAREQRKVDPGRRPRRESAVAMDSF